MFLKVVQGMQENNKKYIKKYSWMKYSAVWHDEDNRVSSEEESKVPMTTKYRQRVLLKIIYSPNYGTLIIVYLNSPVTIPNMKHQSLCGNCSIHVSHWT